MVAGASHIGWRNFLLGTVIGLAPGVVTTSVFIDRTIAAIREPSSGTFALLVLIIAAIVALAWVLQRIVVGARARAASQPVPATHGS
jgi:uncharacterized membrane protein YdjX (TVP38/TMEM64 family)